MKVYMNSHLKNGTRLPVRKIVEVVKIKENAKTIWVRLPNGDEVRRNKLRDIVGADA